MINLEVFRSLISVLTGLSHSKKTAVDEDIIDFS